jgi:hypothetical protein
MRAMIRTGTILLLAALASSAIAQELEFAPAVRRLPPVVDVLPAPIVPVPAMEEIAPQEDLPAEVLPEDESWWWIPSSWYKPLEGSAELGLNGTEGNSQTFNIRVGAKAKYTLPWVEHSFEMIHVDNSSNGVKTALNGYFDGRTVFPLADTPWSWYIHKRVEYDDFRDYNSRISGDTGVGYNVWKTDMSRLLIRSGISASHEVGGTDNNVNPELTFGMDLSHKFDDRQKISLVSDYYPSVEDFNDYRINTTASWEIVVSQQWGLSAKLSIIDRYDNTPHGRRPNDLNYAALMLWAF